MERVIAYVDGYNLYYGLRQKRWKRLYWLNIQAMVKHLLKPGQMLVDTKYFTTVFPPGRSSKALKQAANAQIYVGRNVLVKSVFPDQIVKPDGYVLRRPVEWR